MSFSPRFTKHHLNAHDTHVWRFKLNQNGVAFDLSEYDAFFAVRNNITFVNEFSRECKKINPNTVEIIIDRDDLNKKGYYLGELVLKKGSTVLTPFHVEIVVDGDFLP
jgi:hypothetical protein